MCYVSQPVGMPGLFNSMAPKKQHCGKEGTGIGRHHSKKTQPNKQNSP